MPLRAVRFENGQIFLDGYPDGATVHGIEGEYANKLKRLLVFRGELESVQRWLLMVSTAEPTIQRDDNFSAALCDAALIAFCRCFDFDHLLKPLKPKKVFLPPQRSELERLRNIRNKKDGHDNQLTTGTFALLIQDKNRVALEAATLSLSVPFAGMAEVETLRRLSAITFDWVKFEYERIATEIVQAHNALPMSERPSSGGFAINIGPPHDHFAPITKQKTLKK